MKLTYLFNSFFQSEKTGGLLLLTCTAVSLLLANTGWQEQYLALWQYPVADHAVSHWINDGLMAIFFLLIGLELEREVYVGELSSVRRASLPAIAALGGMLVPAGIHLFFNGGSSTQGGAGIPMATDIAFAVGILSLLGNRVPASLKVFLTALAVIDDLGAIVTIALFYSGGLLWSNLAIALSIFAMLFLLNRLKVTNLLPYIIGGVVMWYFMLHSGVHATITGVLLAFAIPFGDGSEKSPSGLLAKALHKPVAFVILPLFALANTCLVIESNWAEGLLHANCIGIFFGLVIGKPLGIMVFTFVAVSLGVSTAPAGLRWSQILGAGFLGGIGFTMSIFITLLAFQDEKFIMESKITILLSSLVAGFIGLLWLAAILKARK